MSVHRSTKQRTEFPGQTCEVTIGLYGYLQSPLATFERAITAAPVARPAPASAMAVRRPPGI